MSTPTTPPNPPTTPQPPKQPRAKSSYEELNAPERSLPPVVPILIAAVVVAIVVFIIVRTNKVVTPATGFITKSFYVEQTSKDRVLVGIECHIKNGSEKPIYVKDVAVKVTLPTGELIDTPAPPNDVPRYYAAYPALKQSNAEWMGDNTKLMPGEDRDSLFIVGYQINADAWNQRKGLEVTINLYDQKPLVLRQ